MQQILQMVEDASQKFMFGHVTLDEEGIAGFRLDGLDESVRFFSPPAYLAGLIAREEKETAYKVVHCFNAIQASLQYAFFSGNASVRLGGVDSQWVLRMVDEVFARYQVCSVTDVYRTKDAIITRLVDSQITMLRSRIETIEEVFARLNFYDYAAAYADVSASLAMLSKLICYRQDPFFKKGLFGVMMTGRMLPSLQKEHPVFAAQIVTLPVPADYQIPKMLRHYGLIRYSEALAAMVDGSVILPENSEMERNIRAATVQACGKIAEVNGVSADAVDAYLFAKRKESDALHHLCVTERY